MEIILASIFALGYLAITLEHTLKIDKLIPALAMMAILWAIIALGHMPVYEVNTNLKQLDPTHIDEILLLHLGKTAEIIIFLLGAMTIVEIIDYFNGFPLCEYIDAVRGYRDASRQTNVLNLC